MTPIQRRIAWSIPPIAVIVFLSGRMTTDPDSVRDLVHERLRHYFPGSSVSEADGRIEIAHDDGRRQELDLAALQSSCSAKPRACASAVDDALIGLIDELTGRPALRRTDPLPPHASVPR